MFTPQTNLHTVERHLTREYGTMADFADNLGEDLPLEALIEAMGLVNAAIGSDVDLGPWPEYGRAEDILVYLGELDDTDVDQDTWAAYIGEAREAE